MNPRILTDYSWLGYIVLGVYVTWAFVMVHFAAAIYVCVCYYYTAARTDDQESIRVHTVEMKEQPDNMVL